MKKTIPITKYVYFNVFLLIQYFQKFEKMKDIKRTSEVFRKGYFQILSNGKKNAQFKVAKRNMGGQLEMIILQDI